MAEIILPPEENEETPQVPELNVDKPSGNSKVITIEFEAKKTNKVSTKDTNQQLYTTDTDAWFEFKETSLEGANGTYSVVFRNRHDGSIFQRIGDVVNGVAYYKIPHQEIRHAGAWRGQVVYTLSNGDTTAREFDYDVKGHILDGKDVREIVVEDFETLMSQLRSMKDNAEVELANLVNTANQNETDRQAFFEGLVEDIDDLQANYQELLDTGVLQTNINEKLEQLEEEYAPKLTEVTAQLAQKLNKNSTDLSINMFNEDDRNILQGQEPGTINAVLGEGNVRPENTSFMGNISNNVFTANKEELTTASGHVVSVNDGLINLNGPGGGGVISNVTVSDVTQLPLGTYTFNLELVSGNRKSFVLRYINESDVEQHLMILPDERHKVTITDSVKAIKIRLDPAVSYENLKVRMWANEGDTNYAYQPTEVYKLNEVYYDKPSLSAISEYSDEQGNKMADLMSINNLKVAQSTNDSMPYTYSGEKVNLTDYKKKTYHYDVSYLLEMEGIGNYVRDPEYTFTGQGFTIHNDTAFMFYDSGYCRTIDLISKTEIALFALPERRLSNHAGQANFGIEYADGNSEFPVLYLSSYQENLCYVYSITTTGAEIVQKIYIENGEAWFIDKENDKMVVKMGGLRADGVRKYKYYKVYDLPTLSEGYEINRTDDYASDTFYIRTGRGTSGVNWPTAGFAKEGKIYVPAFQNKLMVYDYFKHIVLTEITFTDPKLTTHEYEQVCEYNGKLVFNFNGGDYLTQMDFG